jgi:DNA-binding transcriptional ArsR family regulator
LIGDQTVTYCASLMVGDAHPGGGGGDPDELDAVFRALADPGRRALMDALFQRDGQSLGELCQVLSSLTRFGVMKHLAVLAEADLVLTEKVGRVKHHYLNPIPIRRIHDRWISKYAEASASALLELADALEAERPRNRPGGTP